MAETIVTKTKDPTENLCDSCCFCIADCDADEGLLEFGTGPGEDNVIACDVYRREGTC